MYDDIIQRKRWNPGIIYTPYIPLQMKTTLSKNGITVYIDTVTGISGTSIPIGTKETPVNNLKDAIEILEEYNNV